MILSGICKSDRRSHLAVYADRGRGNLFRDNINTGDIVKSYAEHQYEVTAGEGPGLQGEDRRKSHSTRLTCNLATLMNHSFIINGLQQYKHTVNYLQTYHSDIGFVLGEQGRFYPAGADGNTNLLGVFGSALWTIDYSLYSMSIVSRSGYLPIFIKLSRLLTMTRT